jgi:hypothetical protein
MKKIIIFSILLLFVFCFAGCSHSFNFKTTSTLKEKYQYSQKAEDLIFFYNIRVTGETKLIDLNIKNMSNLFVSNLAFDLTDGSGKLSKYLYVGNIKNLNSKVVSVEVDKNVDKLFINYKYSLIQEDAFLNRDKINFEPVEKTSTTILLLK